MKQTVFSFPPKHGTLTAVRIRIRRKKRLLVVINAFLLERRVPRVLHNHRCGLLVWQYCKHGILYMSGREFLSVERQAVRFSAKSNRLRTLLKAMPKRIGYYPFYDYFTYKTIFSDATWCAFAYTSVVIKIIIFCRRVPEEVQHTHANVVSKSLFV